MKKSRKKSKTIFDHKVTITIDESLSEVKFSAGMARRLEEINKHLSKLKVLPK